MRIKNHPRAIVEVYVDGRVELFHEDHATFRDAIKIGLIQGTVNNHAQDLAENLAVGRYTFTMTKYRVFKRITDFEMKPV